jgi:endoglucanase
MKIHIPSKMFSIILLINQSAFFILLVLLFTAPVLSQLPTASEIAKNMKAGWNIVNTLEVPNSDLNAETYWGNPKVNQTLITAVRNAGFNTIRIPCAWDSHANKMTMVIDTAWLRRVREVVDYCYANNMYIFINCHWDNGWLENNVTVAMKDSVNKKQNAYWTQIANYFKNYDEHLLFASANEPNVSDATGMTVLLSYHQTFIDAVRSTGGNNSSRVLIIQCPSTDIQTTNTYMNTLPTDQINNRLMVELHYYTPWNFCGMSSDASWGNMFYFWGNNYHSTTNPSRNATWGEESTVESYFQLMKTKFFDKGIPIILGEYGAIKRTSLTGDDLALHIASREYWFQYITNAALRYGMIPFCWDNGIFDRNNGAVLDQGTLDAIMRGAIVATSVQTSKKSESNATAEYVTAMPNPVRASTTIQFSIRTNARTDIMIYNILGQQVARFNDLPIGTGLQSVAWNPATLTNGIYFIVVHSGNRMLTNKIVLVR